MTEKAAGNTWLAQAKINLALHVTGRRNDGYHDLDMLVVFGDIGDRITVSSSTQLQLTAGGPFADKAPIGSGNLAMKAAWALWTATDRRDGARIALEKHLPIGAGLGGGSADAACVLLALNQLWELGLSITALAAIAGKLGADVPLCLHPSAVRAQGIGEIVEPVKTVPPLPLVLAWPGVGLLTRNVFRRRAGPYQQPIPELPVRADSVSSMVAWIEQTRNGLSDAAESICPQIIAARKALLETDGCLLARMTGSGSTCFGIYGDRPQADAAAALLQSAHPDWWVAATTAR